MFRLPFLFILTGLISFALFQLITVQDLGIWLIELGDMPRFPTGWSRVHLLVLGWGTMIAMGAVYQLIPVVLQNQNLYSRKLGFVHYGFLATGLAGMVTGFQLTLLPVLAIGATLALTGILLFAFNIGMTLSRAPKWTPVLVSAACAIGYLVCAGISGLLMGLNFSFEWWGNFHDQLLGAHLWFGTVGWFTLLITGFSYKMLPMFYLSHGHPEKQQKWVIVLLNLSVLTGACSSLFAAPRWVMWGALLLFAAGMTVYASHLGEIYRHRHKPDPGAGMKWTGQLAAGLALLAWVVVFLLAFFPQLVAEPRMQVILGFTYLWGFIGMTVMSYLSKIVPFLWWTHKYGPLVGKTKIPTMAQLISERVVQLGLSLMLGSLFLLLAGLGWNVPVLTASGGCLLALSSLFYAGNIAAVFLK